MRCHALELYEFLHAPDVDNAPVAFRFSRRESYRVNAFACALAHAVNPAKTQSLAERFGIGDALLAGSNPVETHKQLCGRSVIALQPFSKGLRVGKVSLFHAVTAVRARAVQL